MKHLTHILTYAPFMRTNYQVVHQGGPFIPAQVGRHVKEEVLYNAVLRVVALVYSVFIFSVDEIEGE